MNGAELNGLSIGFTPLGKIDEVAPSITEPSRLSALNFNNRQLIFKFDRLNNELLFVTMMGTTKADPKEGEPREKLGAVGQGGPKTA